MVAPDANGTRGMYEMEGDGEQNVFPNREEEATGAQLLLNYMYCIGHEKSSLLLCVMSLAGYINYNSSSPNAVVRWSTWDHTEEWLQKSITEKNCI